MKRIAFTQPAAPAAQLPELPEYLARELNRMTLPEKLSFLAKMERNVRLTREHLLVHGQGEAAPN